MSRNMYEQYYLNQIGHGGLPYFRGTPYMKGYGLGGILGNLMKSVVPMLKSTGKTLLREGLKTGTGILTDAIEGQNIKESASNRLSQSANNITRRAARNLTKRLKYSPPPGVPVNRKRKAKTSKKRRVKRKRDIFG